MRLKHQASSQLSLTTQLHMEAELLSQQQPRRKTALSENCLSIFSMKFSYHFIYMKHKGHVLDINEFTVHKEVIYLQEKQLMSKHQYVLILEAKWLQKWLIAPQFCSSLNKEHK